MEPNFTPLEDEESRRAFVAMSPWSRLWSLQHNRRLLLRLLVRREDVPPRLVPLFRFFRWLPPQPGAPSAGAPTGYRDAPSGADEPLPDVRPWYRRMFS